MTATHTATVVPPPPRGRRTPWVAVACRCALTALVLWVFLGHPSTLWLARLVPVQRSVFALLMPDFAVQTFQLEQRGPHLKLRATTVNTHYLLVRGQTIAPGAAFDVESPARMGLLYSALIVVGGLWLARPVRRRVLGAALVGSALLAMPLLVVPVVLAGQQWGLALTAFEEASLPALWVGLSGFLLHGGGFALSAATVWAGVAITRHAQRG